MASAVAPAPGRGARRLGLLLAAAAVLAALFVLGGGAGPAQAAEPQFEIDSFRTTPSDTQAGGHPDFTVRAEFDNHFEPFLDDPCSCNDVKDIIVDLPEGFVANPHATPQCTRAQFAGNLCAPDSQIGTTAVFVCLGAGFCFEFAVPLYNLVPTPDQAGLVGFKTLLIDTPVFTELTARTDSDYGLVARTTNITHVLPIKSVEQKIWGVPADPKNDPERYAKWEGFPSGPNTPSNSPKIPFTQNPTTCGEPLESTLHVTSYNGAEDHASTSWPATTGCSQLAFNPSLVGKPTTTGADSPSGLDIELTVPQNLSPSTPSPSEIRHATVTLPEGITLNPNAADGKASCTAAEASYGTRLAARCPETAKIGTLEIHSAVLPGTLPGAVYIGEPKPGDRYQLVLVADGFGVHVKLPGSVKTDPVTGRLVASFLDLPQFPFEVFNMHFFGSERGLLATPSRCGEYAVDSTFVPWDAELPTQKATQFFTVSSGPAGTPCPGQTRPFAPSFKAASAGNTPGAYSPFQLRLSRPDGDQNLSGLQVTTPPGFTAKLAGIPYCPEAALAELADPFRSGLVEQASPACPAASQIGTATTGAGAGTVPVYTPGKVYLAGPYKGDPLSLVTSIPAVSGPYDLGNVAIRSALHVDPVSARVTTISDQLPTILEGIPLRLRSIDVNLERPGFALNPTNCRRNAVAATAFGSEGAQASRSVHYQVANCGVLDFDPKLSLKLTGGLKRRGHPALHATLTTRPGEANIAAATVTLPKNELLDNAHIGTICNRVQFAADSCPAASIYGRAQATTKLLDRPLRGNVYLRSSRNELPDLVVDLEGQIDIELVGVIESAPSGGLRTKFLSVPDAPVTSFSLDLLGGKKGLLQNSENVCGLRQRVKTRLIGQNRAVVNHGLKLQAACGSGARHKRSGGKAGR